MSQNTFKNKAVALGVQVTFFMGILDEGRSEGLGEITRDLPWHAAAAIQA